MKNIFELFCEYLSDYKNWKDDGISVLTEGYCRFYKYNPDFRVSYYIDETRGNKGHVDPSITEDYEWIGATESAIEEFKAGKNPFGPLMNAKWVKINLQYKDLIVDDVLAMCLDNEKVIVAYPRLDRTDGKWRYSTTCGEDGLPYYVSVLFGDGMPTIDRNGIYPKNVEPV